MLPALPMPFPCQPQCIAAGPKAAALKDLPPLQVDDRGYDTGAISPLMSPRGGDDDMVRPWLHAVLFSLLPPVRLYPGV